jgi:hypothetical protein
MSQNGDNLYSTLRVPPPIVTYSHLDSSIIQINASGALVNHGDIILEGTLKNNSYTNTPMIDFNGSSINVSSTLINTNSGFLFSNVGNSSGIPFSSVSPNASWAHSGRLYYTNMTDSNDNTIKVLCIV